MVADASVTWYMCLLMLISFPVVIMPFVGYCIFQYYQHRNEIYFEKRHQQLLLINFVTISLLCVCIPLQLSLRITNHDQGVTWRIAYQATFANWRLLSMFFILRAWCLYFDHSYHLALANYQWRMHFENHNLNDSCRSPLASQSAYMSPRFKSPSQVQNDLIQTNFFVRHKHTLGHTGTMIPIVLFVFTLFTVLVALLAFVFEATRNTPTGVFVAMIEYAIETIFAAVIWCKFPSKITDSMYIVDELLSCFKASLVTVVFQLIVNTFYYFIPLDSDWKASGVDGGYPQYGPYIAWTFYASQIVLLMFAAHLCTLGVIKNNTETDASKKEQARKSVQKRYYTWKHVVKTSDGYNEFMRFLCKEFSVETMMYITEYCQFLYEMQQLNENSMRKSQSVNMMRDMNEESETRTIDMKIAATTGASELQLPSNAKDPKESKLSKFSMHASQILSKHKKTVSASASLSDMHDVRVSFENSVMSDNDNDNDDIDGSELNESVTDIYSSLSVRGLYLPKKVLMMQSSVTRELVQQVQTSVEIENIMFDYLYHKYIQSGCAPFEVNISGLLRVQIENKMQKRQEKLNKKDEPKNSKLWRGSPFKKAVNNELKTVLLLDCGNEQQNGVDDNKTLLNLYYKAAKEISSLLNDSFSRFRKTDVFYKIVDIDDCH